MSEPSGVYRTQPAPTGALLVLQRHANEGTLPPAVRFAAREVATYHAPTGDQALRHMRLSDALEEFIVSMVENAPPGPERSTAISRAREAKFWASAAVAMEGR